MFLNLKHVLADRLRQQGIAEGVEAAQVTEAFRQLVADRFGQAAARAFRKLVLRGDTLEVLTASPALASELRMAELDLVEALRSAMKGRVYRLRIFS